MVQQVKDKNTQKLPTENTLIFLVCQAYSLGLLTEPSLREKKADYLAYRVFYYRNTDEIPGFFLLLKNHIFIVRSEDTIFIFHV